MNIKTFHCIRYEGKVDESHTLRVSRGCVKRAAQQEAMPPKYHRGTLFDPSAILLYSYLFNSYNSNNPVIVQV